MITFKEQFDKLTRAYISNEVNPYKSCACFIGNLLNNRHEWSLARTYSTFGTSIFHHWDDEDTLAGIECITRMSGGAYSPEDIVRMENNFLHILERETVGSKVNYFDVSTLVPKHPNYEEALFNAFSSTLDMLKEIHIALGEDVESYTFTKRQLQTT